MPGQRTADVSLEDISWRYSFLIRIGAIFVRCLFALATAPAFAAVTVTISPTSVSLRPAEPKFFKATVSGATDTGVKFYVNGVEGGNQTLGTISIYGIYTAPGVRPGVSVSVKAVSVADPTKSVSAAVTLLNPLPILADVQPRIANSGIPVTVRALGDNFVSGAQIYWGTAALTTTFVSANEVRATYTPTASAETIVSVTVRNPNPGAVSSPPQAVMVAPAITVSMYPMSAAVQLGSTVTFQWVVNNTLDAAPKVNWSVNGIAGGNSTVGTVSTAGVYTAPALLPATSTVQVRATSAQDPKAFVTAVITLLNGPVSISGVASGFLTAGNATFTINGSGFGRTATATLDGAPLTVTFVSPTQLRATGIVKASVGGYAILQVKNPDPGGSVSKPLGIRVEPSAPVLSHSAAFRFLQQASWGPTPDTISRVRQIGRDAWLTEQFNTPASTYVDNVPGSSGLTSLQSQFMRNAVNGADQIRQRVAFALSQIFVISGNKLIYHQQIAPYQRLLLANAFGNFRDLLREVSLSPSMGAYLDMVNNEKPYIAFGSLPLVPNENYARELMQLFTLGPAKLNADGSPVAGAVAYTEADVKQLALALTGWTYPPTPGVPSTWPNQDYYAGQMVAVENRHDTSAKTLLGTGLSAGQTARQDLDAALNVIFNHPNVGPFISYRLIQRLVTGNPSKPYVTRVAAVFANNGQGVRGDLKAVVRAILLDPEAATTDGAVLPANQGHLKEPVLYIASLIRALGGTLPQGTNMADIAEDMGQRLFCPPSVFNYFAPSYRIPGFGIPGPEFQILNAATIVTRANFAFLVTHGAYGADAPVQIDRFDQLGEDVPVLLDAISRALLGGTMQPDMKTSITNAVAGLPDPALRARTALYLVATHARYQSQR
jgi:uncharacterized protein (DUF1800 family)